MKTHDHSPQRTATRILVWASIILGLLLAGLMLLSPPRQEDAKTQESSPAPTGPTTETPDLAPEADTNLLNKAAPKCTEVFSAFLAAASPEARNQFVLSPVTTASRMSRFFSLNPSTKVDPKTLSFAGKSILHLPDANAILTQWKSKDGQQIDAVFRQEQEEWRLDWEHFARYSDYPWAFFLAGSGPSEGEFRLLARERLAEERKQEESISIVLYAPRFGHPDQAGLQSPEFLVSRKTRDGKLLDAAFQAARDGKPIYGSTLPDLNPDEMIRVRVKVRRLEVEMVRTFEITEVVACHWYSVDDAGVEPLVRDEEKPAED